MESCDTAVVENLRYFQLRASRRMGDNASSSVLDFSFGSSFVLGVSGFEEYLLEYPDQHE